MTKPSAPVYTLPGNVPIALPLVQVPIAGTAAISAEYRRYLHDLTAVLNSVSERLAAIETGAIGVIPLAKLTGGGTDGSITIEDGRVISWVSPT